MRRIVTFGLCALALPMLAAGQTKDDFEFWDQNNNGDLTCSEAKDGPDGGLRLPAYEDDRDATGIIYEWLERSRSSDTDNDGVACESTPNAGGYVPNVQPVEPQGCPADAETRQGLQVCEEQPREGYDRDAFGSAYSSLEDDIIDMLPPTMKTGGQVYTPYSCLAFEIRAHGTAATDIEHIVALAEAHDSRIAEDRRRDIAADLDNLTIADPTVNRSQKGDRDAADWTPDRHGRWFAERVIAVKLEYGLSVDPAERDALERLLAGGGAELSCVAADTTSPTVAISSEASAPVTGPFPILVAFSEPRDRRRARGPGRRQRQRLRAAAGEQRDLHRDDHARGLRHGDGGHRGRRGAGQRREPECGGRPVLHHCGPDAGRDLLRKWDGHRGEGGESITLRRRLRGRFPSLGRLAARRRVRAGRGRRGVRRAPADRRGPPPPRRLRRRHPTHRGARLTRTGPDSEVSMGLAGSWAAGAVLVDGDEPARFDQVTTGRAAIFTGGRPVRLPDHRDGWRWEPYAVDGADVRSGASAAPAPDA